MSPRELATAGGQLAGLSAFALAQPLFDLLARNPEFFAVRGSTSADIVFFALALALLPALLLLAIEALAALVDRRLRLGLHLLFLAGFVGLFAAQALKKAGLGSIPILLCTGLLMAAAVTGYVRLRPVRRLLTVLAPAALLFLVLFLFLSPVTKLVFPPDRSVAAAATGPRAESASIVFVILDEFPATAIMAANRRIDPVRYPNLAAFAGDATWFRNITTVSPYTVHAVPSLLTGMRPEEGLLPTFADHPRNLFTLLRGAYRLNVHEKDAHLCPSDLCEGAPAHESFGGRMESLFSDVGVLYAHLVAPPRYERRLPSVVTSWGDFRSDDGDEAPGWQRPGTVPEWNVFLASIRDSRGPALNFKHIRLPHEPWRFLPSCRKLVFRNVRHHTPGLPPGNVRWAQDDWLVTQAHQRMLLQVRCIDALVGELMLRLRRTGLFDSSLVILASDHGVSVRPGEYRREVDPASPTNLADIAFPMLLVKRPGQERGEIVNRHVETIDILPTIAETAGVSIPWDIDGRSLWDEEINRPLVRLLTNGGQVEAPIGPLQQRRDELVREQVSVFGERDDEPGLYGIGPHPELIGRRVDETVTTPAVGLRATIAGEVRRLLGDLPRGSESVPTPIYGSLVGAGAENRIPIAVAVNGLIAAVSWTDGRGSRSYSALVREEAFRPGRNNVEIFAINEEATGVRLARLGRT